MLGFESVSGMVSDGMPSMRRRRPHLSSVRTNQIEVHGTTYLCFPLDHSWFQGNINTDDESSYSLYGERVSPDPEIQMAENNKVQTIEENNNNNESPAEKNKEKAADLNNLDGLEYYRVTLTDHFTGLSHHLPKIGVNRGSIHVNGIPGTDKKAGEKENLFICTEADIRFQVENVYKGQKADMVLQRCLGSSTLLGQKCLVYSGPISILFNEVVETGRSWCL